MMSVSCSLNTAVLVCALTPPATNTPQQLIQKKYSAHHTWPQEGIVCTRHS